MKLHTDIIGLLLAALLMGLTCNLNRGVGSAYSGASLERRVLAGLAAAAAVFSIIGSLLTKSVLEPKSYTLRGAQHA